MARPISAHDRRYAGTDELRARPHVDELSLVDRRRQLRLEHDPEVVDRLQAGDRIRVLRVPQLAVEVVSCETHGFADSPRGLVVLPGRI
jgi:hypothetical protein